MVVNEPRDASQDDSLILHPSSRALYRFWEATRAEQAAPPRAAIDLKLIRELIPFLAIIEPDTRNNGFRWRLAGTMVCNLYRRELTGGSALGSLDSFEADVVGRFFTGVVRDLQPCVLRLRLHTDLDQVIGAELIGLPMLASDGRSVHLFGGIFPFRDIAPLHHRAIASIELSGARSIWTEHLPGDALVRQLDHGERPPFRPLRVIAGGRN